MTSLGELLSETQADVERVLRGTGLPFLRESPPRYFAKSASDRTEAWPYWFVADRSMAERNVTALVARMTGVEWHGGAVLTDRDTAERLAAAANGKDLT